MVKTKLPYTLTFLSGLLLGWLALGWWLWPVAYVGEAYPYELNQADKLRYTQGAVDAFTLTGQVDPDWFAQWTPEEVSQTLAQVAAQPNRQAVAYSLGMRLGVSVQAKVVQDQTPVPLTVKLAKAQTNQADGASLPDWFPYLALAVVVTGLVSGGLWIARNAAQAKSKFEAQHDFGKVYQSLRYVEQQETHYTPLPQEITTLAHARLDFGPDQPTDQHFPVESQVEGEPSWGEFGVNQVEDQPAWDVWLFDQKALVTVTKVLADQGSEELASRGEVVKWYDPVLLETPNLKMVGRVENAFVNEMHQSNGTFSIDITVEAKDEN